MRRIEITDVQIKPQNVYTSDSFAVSIGVVEIIPAILTSDGCYLETSDGYCVERMD